jgi:flagellar biosynthesis component FlhA
MAAPGWLVATMFGKACIGSFLGACSAKEAATTIVAVSVGNGLVYAIAGALLGWGFKVLFSSKSSNDESSNTPQQKTIIQLIQKPVSPQKEDKRPQSKAVVSTKLNKK